MRRETGQRKLPCSDQCTDSRSEFALWPLSRFLLRDWLSGVASRPPVTKWHKGACIVSSLVMPLGGMPKTGPLQDYGKQGRICGGRRVPVSKEGGNA